MEQTINISVTVSRSQAAKLLAALESTDTDASAEVSSNTQETRSSKPATKGGKTLKAAAVEENYDAEETSDDDSTESFEETFEDDGDEHYTVEQVQSMMTKYAKANSADKAKKMLAKFKVKKISELSQAKRDELARAIAL